MGINKELKYKKLCDDIALKISKIYNYSGLPLLPIIVTHHCWFGTYESISSKEYMEFGNFRIEPIHTIVGSWADLYFRGSWIMRMAWDKDTDEPFAQDTASETKVREILKEFNREYLELL